MLSPSLPPACWSTTRIGPSVPVTICVALLAASAWRALKVELMNVGSVQEAAAPKQARAQKRAAGLERAAFVAVVGIVVGIVAHKEEGRRQKAEGNRRKAEDGKSGIARTGVEESGKGVVGVADIFCFHPLTFCLQPFSAKLEMAACSSSGASTRQRRDR